MSVQETVLFNEEIGQDEASPDRSVNSFLRATLKQLKTYLSSSLFPQVGPEMAQRIVSAFGVRTVKIIEKSPEKLGDVRGIGRIRIKSIVKGWAKQSKIKKDCTMLTKTSEVEEERRNT